MMSLSHTANCGGREGEGGGEREGGGKEWMGG